jgi:hypothetical protein
LWFAGAELDSDKSLWTYNISQDATLQLRFSPSLQGGMQDPSMTGQHAPSPAPPNATHTPRSSSDFRSIFTGTETDQDRLKKMSDDISARHASNTQSSQTTHRELMKTVSHVHVILSNLGITKGPFSTAQNMGLVLDKEYVCLTQTFLIFCQWLALLGALLWAHLGINYEHE